MLKNGVSKRVDLFGVHNEIVTLRLEEAEAQRRLVALRSRITSLDKDFISCIPGAHQDASEEDAKTEAVSKETTQIGKVAAFLRAQTGPVDLDTIRRQSWLVDKKGLSRLLNALKMKGLVKRAGRKLWTAARRAVH